MVKKRKYLMISIPLFVCVAILFCVVSYFNTQDNNKLLKEKTELESIAAETTEPTTESKGGTAIQKEYKKAIGNIEKSIDELRDYDDKKNVIGNFFKSLIDSLTTTEPTESTEKEMKKSLRKIMTEECVEKLMNDELVIWDESTKYDYQLLTYSDLDTDFPKMFVKTYYESEDETDARLFEVELRKNNETDYIITNVNITSKF